MTPPIAEARKHPSNAEEAASADARGPTCCLGVSTDLLQCVSEGLGCNPRKQ